MVCSLQNKHLNVDITTVTYFVEATRCYQVFSFCNTGVTDHQQPGLNTISFLGKYKILQMKLEKEGHITLFLFHTWISHSLTVMFTSALPGLTSKECIECILSIMKNITKTRSCIIQQYFTAVKMLNLHIFLIFAQNIDCGYTLEPPH